MIPVSIDSIRVSLASSSRLLLLKEQDAERYLVIVIGEPEAEAIAYQMQGIEVPRPLTHDLLKNVIGTLGGRVSHVLIRELKDETYHATVFLDLAGGRQLEIDSRSSDAIALALRAHASIYVNERVMQTAAIEPEEDILNMVSDDEKQNLSAFSEFIDSLDLDKLDDEEA